MSTESTVEATLPERNLRKERIGIVTSDKMNKSDHRDRGAPRDATPSTASS
jgi:hypothetical protein